MKGENEMEKLKSSLTAKIIAMILLCVIGVAVIMCGAVVSEVYFDGGYEKNYDDYYNEEMLRTAERNLHNIYNGYDEKWYENDESMQKSNLRYNVYELLPDGKEKLVYESLKKGQETIAQTSLYYVTFEYKDGGYESEGLFNRYTHDSIIRNSKQNKDLKSVRSFRVDGFVLPLTVKDNIYENTQLAKVLYNLRYAAMVICGVSAVVAVILFCFLMASAGHKKGEEEIYLNFIAKLPFDALTLIVGVAGFACILFGGAVLPHFNMAVSMIGACVAAAAAVFAVTLYCMCFAARIKKGGFICGVWKSCLLYKFCMWIWKWIKKFFDFCAKYIKAFFLYLPASIRPMAVVAALMLLDVLMLAFNGYELDNQMVWLVISRILALGGILYLLTCFKKINQGMKKVAEEGESCCIDTKYLYGPLKEQAENLNNISAGINNAVAEKMKSERFRTELITNVSHDIKTPLTSIVNYVDLLEKEKPENEKMKEYLEVLSRQSARLKKLIDDLVEASKASSGSLPVNLQKLELGVLLQQTVGEYEEKMAEKGLELIVTQPEEKIEIMADSKHLWRVFDNLMNNISKYAMPGTRVYLNLEKKDGNAFVSFRNISDKRLNVKSEELLERFVRGDSSRNTEGSGLGLSIAQSLTNLQNGEMELNVDGDLFKVTLKFKTI